MKVLFCAFAIVILAAGLCGAQAITKDGFGPLPWGGSVAQAEKAFPGLRHRSTDVAHPYDMVLESAPDQKPEVRLWFYDGKFIKGSKTTGRIEIPPGVNVQQQEDLRQRVLAAIGIDAFDASIFADGAGSSAVRYSITIWRKDLERAARQQYAQKAERERQALLDTVTRALLEQ